MLLKYTVMILNFRYGMQIAVLNNLKEGVALMCRRPNTIKAVFVIHNAPRIPSTR